ncbi:MAG: cytochrome P450, partial [Verrucomicrobiota bacterium]
FVSEGSFHLRQRRMSQPAFHHKRISDYGRVMQECCEELRDRWSGGETLDIDSEMNWLALVIVTKTLFGAEVDPEEARIIRDSLNIILEKFERTTLPPAEKEEFDEARERLSASVYRMIRERREQGEGEDHGDLLSILLNAQDEEGDGSGMTDRQLHDEAMTLFLAGHETTANSLMWTWHQLSQHPEVEKVFHEELESVLGGRTATMEDVRSLPYTEKVFREALRLYPPVWIVGRQALEDIELGGKLSLRKGHVVLLSQFITHRDERFFSEPDRFDPSRWEDEAEAEKRPRYAYFPFSAGSRQCLGEGFAWMEAILALAIVGQRWKLRLAEGHRVVMHPQLTLRSRYGMRMVVTPR